MHPEKFAPGTTFDVRQIKSKYDYFHELNVTASLSGNYGAFGGSASFSFHSLDDLDENSVSWAITAKSDFGSFTLSQPSLSPPYSSLKGIKLLDTCGPEYIAEVDRGVLASVLYTFHSQSEQKLQEVSASLSAGIQAGGWGANGSTSLHDFMKSMSSYGQVTVNVIAIGGKGVSALQHLVEIDPTDLDQVRKDLAKYVNDETVERSTILGFRTSPFGNLAGQPEISPDYSEYLASLERINEYEQQLLDYQKKVDRHLYHQSDFQSSGPNSQQDLQDLASRLTNELDAVRQTAKNCRYFNAVLTNALGNANQNRRAKQLFAFSSRPAAGIVIDNNGKPDLATKMISPSLARPTHKNVGGTKLLAIDNVAENLAKAADQNDIGTLEQLADQSCDIYPDTMLLADLQVLSPYPFVFDYSFDDYSGNPVFPAGNDVLYVQLKQSSNVSYVEVKDSQKNLLGMESNDNASDPFGFELPLDSKLRGQAISILVTMVSGSSYEIVLDVPKT